MSQGYQYELPFMNCLFKTKGFHDYCVYKE